MPINDLTLGYAFCGSFCTIKKSIEKLRELKSIGCNVISSGKLKIYAAKKLLKIYQKLSL